MKKIILILLLIFGFYLSFLPHTNYDYPLHVDEWVHFTYSKHISDNSPLYFEGESNSLEPGFHILLAVLNSMGLPYLFMFKFFASFLTVLICLSIFILVRKWFDETSALFSVLFIVIMKSTVALLGPMFFVPMAVGLFLIPIGLYLIDSKLLFLIIATLLIIHPPSGIALLILINCYLLSSLILHKKFKFNLIIQQVVGILISLPLFISVLHKGVKNIQFGTSLINTLFIPRFFGYILTALIILGFYLIIHRKKYTFFFYSVILLILAFIYYNFGVNILIFYERNLMYLFESFSIPFGVACGFISFKFKRFRNIAFLLLIIILLALTVPQKIDSTKRVYHVINETEYNDFNLIKNEPYGLAVLDPWKAIAFTPISEKPVYSRVPQGFVKKYMDRNNEIFDFFKGNCTDKNFLIKNNISIVYGCSSFSSNNI